jgi:hypothetical protein
MDAASAEAMSRDGGETVEHVAPLLPPGARRQDVGTLGRQSQPKILLLRLSERASSRGNIYLTGWCSAARLVDFKAAEPDKFGCPQWEIFAAEPDKRP